MTRKNRLIGTILVLFLLVLSKTAMGADYDYAFDSQSSYPVIVKGQAAQLWVRLKNTGTQTWFQKKVNLGTCRSNDRSSIFYSGSPGNGWLSSNRIMMSEPSVSPGSYGTFNFTVFTTNVSAGSYNEYFCPVVEGIKWLNDIGLFWKITVTSPAPAPTPTPQPKPTPQPPAPTPQPPNPNPTYITAPTPNTEMRLLSANVGSIRPQDYKVNNKLRDQDVKYISNAVISLKNPEIVLLQELGNQNQCKQILPDNLYHTSYDGYERCTGVRKDKYDGLFSVAGYTRENLSNFWGYELAALRKDGRQIYIINVHTSSPFDDMTFTTRPKQIKGLVKRAEQLANEGKPVILAGDFNYDPFNWRSKAAKLINDNTVVYDNYKQFAITMTSSSSLTLYTAANDYSVSIPDNYVLDHVLSNINLGQCDPGRFNYPNKLTGNFVFDHSAIYCRN